MNLSFYFCHKKKGKKERKRDKTRAGSLYDRLIADVSCRVAGLLGFLFATTERRKHLAPFLGTCRATVEPPNLACCLPTRCQVIQLHLPVCVSAC